MGKRTPHWAFVSMGLNITATQGLLIRLLLVSFSGNELSVGLILGSWMLAEALGSHLGGRFAHRLRDAFKSFVFLQMVFAIMLPLTICACYLARRLGTIPLLGLAGAAPGEALGLVPIFWTSLLLLTPLSAVHGAMFSIGCATYSEGATQDHTIVGRLYMYEALGAMGGGVILTFVFIPHFRPVQIGLLLSLLGLASALLLLGLAKRLRYYLRWGALAGLVSAMCLYLLLSPQAIAWHHSLVQLRWGEIYHVVYERDSPYGNIAVTQLLGQYTFLANGAPVLTTPFPDIVTIEETAHLPLLFHPEPQRILVVGGGLGGVLYELLKYPMVESVDYAELDPLLIKAVRAFPTTLTNQELQDPRLHLHSVDGRLFLNQMAHQQKASARKYDIVLVNLPYPSTLELNRFYTVEFFQLIQQVLNEKGLAVFPLPGSLTYIGPGMRDLNLMVRNGLQAVFPNVRPIPGDSTLWLASPSLPLTSITLQELVISWQQRALSTRFITTEHLQVQFDPQRLAWFQNALQPDRQVHSNHDLRPAGVLYGLGYWSEIFAPTTYRLLTNIGQITFWQWCLLPIFLTFILRLVHKLRRGWKGIALPVVVATTGFGGMVCDLMIIFTFQALYGYAYQLVGLIIATFMSGLALGGWTMSRYLLGGAKRKPSITKGGQQTLLWTEITLIVYWLILPLLLPMLSSLSGALEATLALLLLNALGGWLVGLQFPLSSRLHLSVRGEAGYTAGILYAADLTGAFLGAVAVGIALLPVLGTARTCLFVATLKACSLVVFATTSNDQTAQTPGTG